MAKPVVLTEIAENDLGHIAGYLSENWGPKVSDNFIDRFESLCRQISRTPSMFPLIHKKKKIRKSTLTPQNTLYYRETKSNIEIITIFDTRQDPDKLTGIFKQTA